MGKGRLPGLLGAVAVQQIRTCRVVAAAGDLQVVVAQEIIREGAEVFQLTTVVNLEAFCSVQRIGEGLQTTQTVDGKQLVTIFNCNRSSHGFQGVQPLQGGELPNAYLNISSHGG